MNRTLFFLAFAAGLLTVAWIGSGFLHGHPVALGVTMAIALAYLIGGAEQLRLRAGTAALERALQAPPPADGLDSWLAPLPDSLRTAVRQRIEGTPGPLPGPALTPTLVGLLVMLGMLGTFLGLIVTFRGAVFAVEGSADLQAMRAALAAPIKGLGLAFGTSVAGVAASAMLGLMSALSRRERLDATRRLDAAIASALRPFSLGHQRAQTLAALQTQAQALPAIVERLEGLIAGVERRSDALEQRLTEQQRQFHEQAQTSLEALSTRVGSALQQSLAAGAQAAGDSLRPVLETALQGITEDARRMHAAQVETTQTQLERLGVTLETGAQRSLETQIQAEQERLRQWTQTLGEHARTEQQRLHDWRDALQAHAQAEGQRLERFEDLVSRAAETEAQRVAAWEAVVASSSNTLREHFAALQAADAQRGQAAAAQLESLQAAWSTQWTELQQRADTRWTALQQAAAAQWAELQEGAAAQLSALQSSGTERLSTLEDAITRQLQALEDSSSRGLQALQRSAAEQLNSLGQGLEAPMTRLLETAAHAPRAAAEVIIQLREQMAQLSARDLDTQEAQATLMRQTTGLLTTLQAATTEQRAAVESLVNNAAQVLEDASARFAQALESQTARATALADEVIARTDARSSALATQATEHTAQAAASAIELSSLAEGFRHGVELFSASNAGLLERLQALEATLARAIERSDEQLAYYVGQAREVIELSVSAQQGLLEDLRQLRDASLPGDAGAAPRTTGTTGTATS